MAFTHIDLIGLNKYEMHDAPIVRTNAELRGLKDEMPGKSYSIAGMRHSQGGHTALEGECMVFTEAMEQSIKVSDDKKTVTINAGATWSDLHFHLGPLGLAPLVHQSSPHFSIGGSLSVDCHGREVTEGALSNTVESINVLTNKERVNEEGVLKATLEVTFASRIENSDLFWATLGGYGACGVILDAKIRITENKYMYKFGTTVKSLDDLSEFLDAASQGIRKQSKRLTPQKINMFYAWMDVSQVNDNYLTHAMVYEYIPQDVPSLTMKVSDFKNEGWAGTEAMRAAWSAGRRDPVLRGELFKIIAEKTTQNPDGNNSRINFLREEISFTSSKGDAEDVDLLQEFFIPLSNITKFLTELKNTLLPYNNPNLELLSCTLRIIQSPPNVKEEHNNENNKPYLSYANRDNSSTPMVSVALEVKVKKIKTDTAAIHTGFKVDDAAVAALQAINIEAQKQDGNYYLPYYQIATNEHLMRFRSVYPRHGLWKTAADKWNPKNPTMGGKRMFSNEFLRAHLDA